MSLPISPTDGQNRMIPVNTPLLDGNEKKYLLECIDSGWISSEGPFVERFEKEFAKAVNRKHGIAVANGSGALDIAVAAAKIGPGDEVIMPTFTIISPAASVVRAGGIPVLVDSDPVTWNMDVNQIEKKITAKTKAILAVHIYGLPVDMNPVLDIAHRYGLIIIEDAAEMHGQTYFGRPCGSFGLMSTFSFYANKHITCGEGGMVVTDDDDIAAHCRKLRNLCFEPGRRFVHKELGWNYRITNMQAAVALAQLEKLPEHVDRKRKIGRAYLSKLTYNCDLQLPLLDTPFAENVFWVFGVIDKTTVRGQITNLPDKLKLRGVDTRPFFYPLHRQPALIGTSCERDFSFPAADLLADNGFYVPSGLALTDTEIDAVAAALNAVVS